MKRKKNACFKKKKIQNCVLLCDVAKKEEQLYYSGFCLHDPGLIVKPSTERERERERLFGQREKKRKRPQIGCTASASGLASGISQSECVLR